MLETGIKNGRIGVICTANFSLWFRIIAMENFLTPFYTQLCAWNLNGYFSRAWNQNFTSIFTTNNIQYQKQEIGSTNATFLIFLLMDFRQSFPHNLWRKFIIYLNNLIRNVIDWLKLYFIFWYIDIESEACSVSYW